MKVPHTPGPWTCAPTSHHAHDYRLGIPTGQMPFTRGEGVEYANARLIAAAPDLLEALQGLLAEITEYQTINNLGGENNHWQVIARAAIAKATGEVK